MKYIINDRNKTMETDGNQRENKLNYMHVKTAFSRFIIIIIIIIIIMLT